MWNFDSLKAQPASPQKILDPIQIKKTYRFWRMSVLAGLFIGYAGFYLIRLNLSAATPSILEDLHFSKTQVGVFLSIFAMVYGLSKFLNGILGDRSNARYFMAIGLVCSAITNICFGLSSGFYTLAIFWGLNGWFQGMGWPPCARGLTQWYSVSERGTYWGIWNASHQVGGATILFLAGYLITHFGWRTAFSIPAALTALIALIVLFLLRDNPPAMGLPSIEEFKNEPTGQEHLDSDRLPVKEILTKHVFNNPYIWAVAVGNFFVYVVRYGALSWAPTFLVQIKGATLATASAKTGWFEIMGLIGAFSAGFISDRYFGSRRGPINVIYMFVLIGAVLVFWLNPKGAPIVDAIALGAVGFFVYGPQMLVGVSAADLAGKHAAATATGFTGWLGYLGSVVAGVGFGWTVDHYGWNGGFALLALCALLGTFCFMITWNVKAGGKK